MVTLTNAFTELEQPIKILKIVGGMYSTTSVSKGGPCHRVQAPVTENVLNGIGKAMQEIYLKAGGPLSEIRLPVATFQDPES